MKAKFIFLLFISFVCIPFTNAQVKLPALIGDNMVLQRESTVNIWGTGKPNAPIKIKCQWNSQLFEGKSNGKGEWSIQIKTPEAGGPYQMEISDGIPVTLKNILIGEVWICSGQSNMEMPVKGFINQPVLGSQETVFESMGKDNIRMFTVRKSASKEAQTDCVGNWKIQNPENVLNTSATAYYFAERINQSLGIPVGIIVSAWGGSSILAWMPEASILKAIPRSEMERIHQLNTRVQNSPDQLYNGMIYPLKNYKAKGFLWYQGEANLNEPTNYEKLQTEMVNTWRSIWSDKQNQMPFYFVQIAPHRYGRGNSNHINRPLFVESQMKTMKTIPNSKMATTTDLGSEICIHPAQKKEVGNRLALLALANTYNIKGFEAEFPQLENVEYKDAKAHLNFKTPIGVSVLRGTYGDRVQGFEIAGADKKFYPAKAYINSRSALIVVESDRVSDPVAVRYAFKNYCEGNLVNHIGVSAPSFRTDSWNDIY